VTRVDVFERGSFIGRGLKTYPAGGTRFLNRLDEVSETFIALRSWDVIQDELATIATGVPDEKK